LLPTGVTAVIASFRLSYRGAEYFCLPLKSTVDASHFYENEKDAQITEIICPVKDVQL